MRYGIRISHSAGLIYLLREKNMVMIKGFQRFSLLVGLLAVVKADKSYKPSPYLFNIKSISLHPLL